jgi:tetratricopeptide (TPR) repeat protein
MKKLFVFSVLVFSLTAAYSQNLQDGIKALYNENYSTAKKIFLSLTTKNPADAEIMYYTGRTYYISDQKDSAKACFEKGILANPKLATNFVGLGRFYLDQENVPETKTNFDKAISLGNKDVRTLQLIGEAYANVPTKSNADNKSAPNAISTLEKALGFDKKNALTFMLLGDAYQSKFDGGGQAVTNYEYASQNQEYASQAYTKIGMLYAKAKNYSEALNSFEKAIAADSLYPPVYRELGELYYQSKQYIKAKDTYAQYMALADPTVDNQSRYASFLFLSKDYESTIKMINNVIEKDPSNFILSRLIAYSYYEQGKYKEGLEYIEKFFKLADPKKIYASDYEYLGKLQAKTGNDSVAVINLSKAIELDSSKAELHNDIAQLYYKKKKYLQAAEQFELKMSKIKPNVQDYFQVGKCYYYAEDYAKADSAFSKVTLYSPNAHVGFLWRGRCNSNIDSTASRELAKPYYEKCAELASADPVKNKKDLIEAYQYLGWLSIQKDNNTDAKQFYQKVLELDPANEEAKKVVTTINKL